MRLNANNSSPRFFLPRLLLLLCFGAFATACSGPTFTVLTSAPISESFDVDATGRVISVSQGLVMAVECTDYYEPCVGFHARSEDATVAKVQPAFLGAVAYVDPYTGQTVNTYSYTAGDEANVGETAERTGFLLTALQPGRSKVTIDVAEVPYEIDVFVEAEAP